MITKKFYVIEYYIDGETDIKHAEMSPEELNQLTDFLNKKGVKYTIHDLSKSSSPLDVNSIDVRTLLGKGTN